VRADERGAGSVLALPLLGVVAVTALLLAHLAGALVAARRAAAAADLAALAGAEAWRRGADACGAAALVAARNHAALETCRVAVDDVLLTVRVDVPGVVGRAVRVTAQARAGPSSPG
jgi:secretion/DNA translocation related TadE-like protein